ncbi:hypothetical protein H4R21_001625, partial [Coemansia helicoidea]
PFNATLQQLTLKFDGMTQASKKVAFAKYLLMRLPKLVAFSAPGVSVPPVLDFARKYSRFYPHLENAQKVFINVP